MEHCEAANVNRYTADGEHWMHTQERFKHKINTQERKLAEKATHLLSKPGIPKMLRDKLSGESSKSKTFEDFDSGERVKDSNEVHKSNGTADSKELHGPTTDSNELQGPVLNSKEVTGQPELGTDQFGSITPGSETSTLSTCSLTEFSTDDENINKARIPREQVIVDEYINRGAFGKVYRGTYNRELVAVKTMSDVETFVKEIKMAATMSHPNIVRFIGVA